MIRRQTWPRGIMAGVHETLPMLLPWGTCLGSCSPRSGGPRRSFDGAPDKSAFDDAVHHDAVIATRVPGPPHSNAHSMARWIRSCSDAVDALADGPVGPSDSSPAVRTVMALPPGRHLTAISSGNRYQRLNIRWPVVRWRGGQVMKSLLSPLLAVILLTLLVFTVQAAGEFAETVLLGDLDGDEDPDLLVSDPGDGTAGEDAGAIYVFLDPPTGNLTASDADIRITGAAGSQFGTGMALADMDGDDDLDIVIGAPNASNGTGAVYVFLQPFANGTYLDADVTLSAPAGFLGFGATIAGTEVSGDNRTDLAIASIHRPEGTGLVGEYFD
ncbi:MAG TPA: hypothetical protein EYP43_02900, partial [Thermoplasmata archaeon]|nr:hypothetical protein [Thermoplasmata archaeon]